MTDLLEVDYSGAGVPVRADLRDAHRFLLQHLRAPGTWWTGAERIAIAAEARRAMTCRLCRERKAAISAAAVAGAHETDDRLPPPVVDVIHRVRSDPARLSRPWFDALIAGGLAVERYVELIALVSLTAGLDYFARALGIPPFTLPSPLQGELSRYSPPSAHDRTAWVPTIAAEDASGAEADLYGERTFVPNIVRALSLVPDEVRALWRWMAAHYLPVASIPDPTARRALDRTQIELVAARVSALNQCFY